MSHAHPPLCDPSTSFVFEIGSCVPASLFMQVSTALALYPRPVCPGGTLATAADFERIRFCRSISGNLVISNTETDVDFAALSDIETVDGTRSMFKVSRNVHSIRAGYLLIQGTSLVSVSSFASLSGVGSNGAHYYNVILGQAFAISITGLAAHLSIGDTY